MKLVVAAGLSQSEIGGPATFCAHLCELLPQWGIQVDVQHFSAVRSMPRGSRHIAFSKRIAGALSSADAVLALDTVSVGVPTLLACLATGKPYYLRVPGDYAWEQGRLRFAYTVSLDDHIAGARGRAPWQVRVLGGLQRQVSRSARAVIVPSEYLRRVVHAWDVPAARVVLIDGGTSFRAGSERDSARIKIGLRPTDRVILVAGRFVPHKRLVEACRVFVHVCRRVNACKFLAIGEGPCLSQMQNVLREAGVDEHSLFIGPMPRDSYLALLSASDVFLSLSEYEGRSHQIMEAMMAGVPVVASDIPGNRELIESGVSGLLVDGATVEGVARSVTRVLETTSLARRISEASRRRSADFQVDRSIQSLAELLKGSA